MCTKLERGKAVIITGPEGCGKSTLAIKMAKEYGTYKIIPFIDFISLFGRGMALDSEPDVLIVEDFVPNSVNLAKTKQLITNDEIMVNKKYEESRRIKTPIFIFCKSSVKPIRLSAVDRRYTVIDLSK